MPLISRFVWPRRRHFTEDSAVSTVSFTSSAPLRLCKTLGGCASSEEIMTARVCVCGFDFTVINQGGLRTETVLEWPEGVVGMKISLAV